MAWAERMPSGGWRGVYRTPAGKKRTVSDGGKGFGRKKDAKDAAEEESAKARRRAGLTRKTSSIPWGQWWDQLAEDRELDSDGKTTEESIARTYLKPQWELIPLNQIEGEEARRWVKRLRKTKSKRGTVLKPSYIGRIVGVFRMSINQAIEEGLLETSPLVGLELPPVVPQPKPYLTHDEFDGYKKALRDDYVLAVEFLLETGFRPNELCGMHAESIDGEWVLAWHVLVEHLNVIRPYPKNKRVRRVPLTSRAQEILTEVTRGRTLTGGCGVSHSDGTKCKSDLVFRTKLGRPFRPNAIRDHMLNAAEELGLAYKSPYAARRGFVTWAAPHIDPFALQKIVGHADLEETAGYHQLAEAERKRLQVARGETPGLSAVGQGQDQVADHGADSGKTPSDTVGNETDEKHA